MHVLEYLHRNVKTVAMPSAMVAGALLCRPVTALEAWTHQMITPSLIFLMLFVTFCRVKPSQMKPSTSISAMSPVYNQPSRKTSAVASGFL